MPVFDFLHWNKDQGDTLAETGPLIQVIISMPTALEEVLSREQRNSPAPCIGQ